MRADIKLLKKQLAAETKKNDQGKRKKDAGLKKTKIYRKIYSFTRRNVPLIHHCPVVSRAHAS
jgi:hypothetical protein